MKYLTFCFLSICLISKIDAQREPDKIYMPNIKSVKFFTGSNQATYPVISLGATNILELHFDDLDNYIKNYSYTFQLCNADWIPVSLSPFDYINGFTQNRFNQYRVSSIATRHYIHYFASLPERGCVPKVSGNYLLKVFLDSDTSQLAFTTRLLVAEDMVPIVGQIQQPFNSQWFLTHQKLQFSLNVKKLNILSPLQQLKVTVLQNYRWDNAVTGKQPVFMRGDDYEYNGEKDFVFPAGKEYRWVDLRSFRFQSDRIASIGMRETPYNVEVKPDGQRARMPYLYYQDLDGFYEISASENINPWWQGDYAEVNFTFVPDGNKPIENKDLYIIGQMTAYAYDDSTRMQFDADAGAYRKTMLLKQGFYAYTYATLDKNKQSQTADQSLTDGNYWESENIYTVLVYFRAMSDRHDRLVAVSSFNSKIDRKGL